MYEYRVNILKVIDGDTVDVDIELGFNTWIKKERVRIMGIDTPESRTRNKIEKKFGLASKLRLKESDFEGSKQLIEKLLIFCKNYCEKSKKLKIEIEKSLKK